MAQLRAKFRVHFVQRNEWNGETSETVNLSPVYGEAGSENAKWAKATPGGQIQMTISNPAAQGVLTEGQEFYVDFTPCEVEPAEV